MGQYDPIAARRARLQREIREAQLQLDALELVPIEDTYEDGTVIRAEILNPGQRDPLTYVFLKVVTTDMNGHPREGRWYHTGHIQHDTTVAPKNRTYFTNWIALQQWLSQERRVVETWAVMEVRRADNAEASKTYISPGDEITATRGY